MSVQMRVSVAQSVRVFVELILDLAPHDRELEELLELAAELDAHVIGRFNVEVGKVRVEVRLRDGALRWRALSKSKRGDRSTDSRCLTREGDT